MAYRNAATTAILVCTAGLTTLSPASAGRISKPDVIQINGSSTMLPFTQAAISAFADKAAAQGVQFKARGTGTTAGLREFCAGAITLAAASRPINTSELKACASRGVRFLELPVAFDAITVVVSKANTWARQISTEELRRLWSRDAQGRVLRWKQVNSSWPDQPISLCAPGPDSGTYDTFNKAINGREDNSRRDTSSSEDDTVLVRCVASNPQALGYFGFDYYQANRSSLRALAINGRRGAVLPSVNSVQQSRYVPLSRPLFLYVSEKSLLNSTAIRSFINSTLQNGSRLAEQAGVIPLHASTYRLVISKLYRNVLGSAFAGQLPLGLTVGQTLDRSFDALKKDRHR